MSELIKTWITNKIGVVMNMNPQVFSADVMDGTIVARLLKNYNIINEEQFLKIIPTDNSTVAYKNYKHIRLWLETIEVMCKEEDLEDIANGKSLSAIKLFYQLYLSLHDKDGLYFSAVKRGNQRIHPTNTRFEVTAVNETTKEDFVQLTDNKLCDQLVLSRGVVEWNKHRYQTLLHAYDDMKERYSKYIHKRHGISYTDKFGKYQKVEQRSHSLEELNDKVDSIEFTHEELLHQEEVAVHKSLFKEDAAVAKKILNKIKQKHRQKMHDNKEKVQQQKLLLMELWNKLLAEQEKELEESVSKKLLKQSVFEKQLTTKMFEVRQQKNNILQNRRFVDDEHLKKREDEFLEHVFLRDKSVADQKYNYYFERDRNLELHKRLYAEKQRLKAERRTKTCSDIANDIVDLSIKTSEYKERFSEEPSPRVKKEWGNLFIKEKSIFRHLDDYTDIVVLNTPENWEEIYCMEFDRQGVLDERELESYINFEWPWTLKDLQGDHKDNLLQIELGMNVLGYDVHRVLLTKYPYPNPLPSPNLPPVTVAACINGLPDVKILPVLQTLLNKRKIRVVEMQDAINCCLDTFKAEIRTEYMDRTLVEETAVAQDQLSKKGPNKISVPQKGQKTTKSTTTIEHSQYAVAVKQTQTPTVYPCEEIVLSRRGELGKTAYDMLNTGKPLTDNLVVAMFVEYLKTLQEVNGWVLINYPTSFSQAILLEEALTGIQIPNASDKLKLELSVSIGDIADLNYREPRMDTEAKNAILRKSKLLPNPSPPPPDGFYSTYLTAYIKIAQNDEEIEDLLDGFYSEQGCHYTFRYHDFELPDIKDLARKVLGEYSIPQKSSDELFGDAVAYLEASLNQAKKAERKPDVNEETQTCPPQPFEDILSTPQPKSRAGELSWHYHEIAFPDYFQNALATLWENVESIYITDFKQLFFIKRIILNAVLPYLTHVRNHMQTFIERPDDKQSYLSDFQNYYNNIEADMRDDVEVKAEIHCAIAKFRVELWEMCDTRMKDAEEERRKMIRDYWLPFQAVELINNYTSAMQLELDRCSDSLQFLIDYYSGVITKMPCKEAVLNKFTLSKLACDTEGSTTSLGANLRVAATMMLTEVGSQCTSTPFHNIVEHNLEISHSNVTKVKMTAISIITQSEGYFKPKSAKKDAGSRKDVKSEKQLPNFTEPAEDVKEARTRLIEEWQCAVAGEYLRARLRLNMLAERALNDLSSMIECFQKTFYAVFDDIRNRYLREIANVNTVCEVFAGATEAEIPLQQELVLDGDSFYIQPNVLLFPEPLPKSELPMTEPIEEGVFTTEQLDVLSDIFKSVAPDGSITERAFTFILQDAIVQDAEDGKGPMVPPLWQQLKPHQVSTLSKKIFGDVEYLTWRDFIIYNMCLKFPDVDKLLETRRLFRENDPDATEAVEDYQFFSIKFWFEDLFDKDDPRQVLKLKLTKQLLFKLYKVNAHTLNYTLLLLDFCKGACGAAGFFKALTLAFGKRVCSSVELGNVYVACVKEQIFVDAEKENLALAQHDDLVKCADSAVSSMIDTTVHICEDVIIEDYESICKEDEHDNITDSEITEIFSGEAEETDGVSNSEEKQVEFSNAEIAFQPKYNPNYVYLLPFEDVLSILTVALPWCAKAQTENSRSLRERLEVIYQSLQKPLFNNNVLAHELYEDRQFNSLLSHNFKFVDKSPPKIVKNLIQNN